MKWDIGMANYEKKVEQEAAYPIPISLYNCYRTVRHEKRYISGVAMPLFSCLTVVQRYRDGVCSLLFHLFFIICHPYIPLHLEEMIFILVSPIFDCAECTINIGAKKEMLIPRYAARGDRTRTAPLRRYATKLCLS